jgi:hypothetical protein
METKQTDSTQAELELSVIKKIMEDSRTIAINNGWHYVYWGIIVSCALIANYIMALMKVSLNYQGMMWFVLMTIASIAAAITGRFAEKKRKVQTFAGKLLGSLWFAGGIAMFMVGFLGTVSGAYNPIYICPIISTILGVTYFTSGAIQQIKWLQMLSFGWWAGAVLTFLYPSIHTLLIFALMMIFFQTIPGIILNRKWKQEMKTAGINQS